MLKWINVFFLLQWEWRHSACNRRLQEHDVRGQPHIFQTLCQCTENGRVCHGLFCRKFVALARLLCAAPCSLYSPQMYHHKCIDYITICIVYTHHKCVEQDRVRAVALQTYISSMHDYIDLHDLKAWLHFQKVNGSQAFESPWCLLLWVGKWASNCFTEI